MTTQQFQEDEPLRSQRMTQEEAQAVIDLWQQEQVESSGLTSHPAVSDVAEGLDITVQDVQRLLHQVRAGRAGEGERPQRELHELDSVQHRLAYEDRQLADARREWARLRKRRANQRGIGPPAAEEWAETVQREMRLKAERWRFSGYVLAGIGAIFALAHLLAWFFH